MGQGDYTLRVFQDTDAPALAALTIASIREVGIRAYSPVQIEAWAARHPGPERFIERVANGDVILVALDREAIAAAYVLCEPDGHVDMLYCHPDHTGRGLGGLLLGEAEAAARRAGMTRLFTEASELARPVFANAGYTILNRRDFAIGPDEAPVGIHNYTMEKQLKP